VYRVGSSKNLFQLCMGDMAKREQQQQQEVLKPGDIRYSHMKQQVNPAGGAAAAVGDHNRRSGGMW
jgi:hypothetical protein